MQNRLNKAKTREPKIRSLSKLLLGLILFSFRLVYLVIHAGSVRPRPLPRPRLPLPPPKCTPEGESPFNFGSTLFFWDCCRYCSSVIHAGLFVPMPRPRPLPSMRSEAPSPRSTLLSPPRALPVLPFRLYRPTRFLLPEILECLCRWLPLALFIAPAGP